MVGFAGCGVVCCALVRAVNPSASVAINAMTESMRAMVFLQLMHFW
jgi:hypothetical protein